MLEHEQQAQPQYHHHPRPNWPAYAPAHQKFGSRESVEAASRQLIWATRDVEVKRDRGRKNAKDVEEKVEDIEEKTKGIETKTKEIWEKAKDIEEMVNEERSEKRHGKKK